VGILTALLGSAVLIRERGSFVSVIFALMTGTGACWLLSYVGIYSTSNEFIAHLWVRFENIAVIFIPSGATWFALVVMQRLRQYGWIAWGTLIASTFFAAAVAFTDSLISGVYLYPWGYYARYGPLSIPFLIYFSAVMLFQLGLYWVEYAHAVSPIQKKRLKSFLIGFLIAYTGSVDFLPAFGIAIYPIGYLSVFVFLIVAARAIWKYHLVSITPAFAADRIIATMNDALLVLDQECVIRVVNKAACQLFNRPEKELVDRSIWTIASAFLPKQKLEKLLRMRAVQTYEVAHKSAQGEERLLEVCSCALRDKEEEPVGIVCVARDITESKRTQEIHRQLAAIVESSEDAIVSCDPEGKISSWNPGAQKLYGYLAHQMMGRPILTLVPPRETSPLLALISKMRLGERFQHLETVHVRSDGKEIPVSISASPIENGSGKINAFSMIIRAIGHEQKAA
jgi:PAS domain S-box-containing protein